MSILRFDTFRDPFRELDRLTGQLLGGGRVPRSMPMDVWRSGDAYHVALDVPGVDPESIDLTVERDGLAIRAERSAGFSAEDEVIAAERPQGQFSRQLLLGEGLDSEGVRAEYAHGVLHLTIPVAQRAQPRKVEVSRGGGAMQSIGGTAETSG